MRPTQTIIELLRTDAKTSMWFSGKRWNPEKRKTIIGHPLIDLELLPLFYRFKKWVFDLLCRLRWLEDDMQPFQTISSTTINRKTLTDMIAEHEGNLYMIHKQQAKYLIIGRDSWMCLTGEREPIYQGFPFGVEYGGDRQIYYRGLRVVIVPWINGLFLLPELER